jgi:TRAP-type C4-dicarboxylate transport system substrate-binding protein
MTTAAVAVLLAQLVTGGASEDPIVLKLGTLAPTGSPWHEALKDLGRRWSEASGGRVQVRVYPGGSQGSEGDMQRKLSVGQLQAVSLSNVGLHDLVPEPQAFSVPLLFRDDGEVACALDRVRDRLDAAAQARGLVAVQWTRLGSASFFCDAPLASPAEVAGARIFAWDGDPGTVKALRVAGFQPVVLASTDLVPALSTRMIDCASQLPLYMLATRAFEKAKYLLDLPFSHVVGATVVRREAWEKIPPALRPRLLAIAREVGDRVEREARRLEQDALAAMRAQGLADVKPASRDAWRSALERTWPVLRGEVVPAPFFDAVVAARDACRAGVGAAGR